MDADADADVTLSFSSTIVACALLRSVGRQAFAYLPYLPMPRMSVLVDNLTPMSRVPSHASWPSLERYVRLIKRSEVDAIVPPWRVARHQSLALVPRLPSVFWCFSLQTTL